MAKLITKFKYLKPDARQSVGGYAKYIATREGVERIDESYKLAQSSIKQQQLIKKILHDFPDTKEMLEYEDYQKDSTVGNASEFITRALEDNAYEVMQTKTYADYIATRPRTQRFGTHGLFTDDGVEVKLDQVSDELNHYGGNVWTVIISLRREDAERLGYNNGERWRDMLRTQTEALAKNFKIPMEKLKWYAAFHNESHHPHVHLMVYADERVKPYLSKQGIMNLRSAFAKDIFAQDLLCVYEKQTEHRNKLRVQSREVIAEMISNINTGIYDNPKLEEMLLQLADKLSRTKGKKVYGYLKPDVKAIINRIVDEIASDDRISVLYDLWYNQKEEILRTYMQVLPKRVPLSDNPEFKSIRNAVIQEALHLSAGHVDMGGWLEEKIGSGMDETASDTEEPPPDKDGLVSYLEDGSLAGGSIELDLADAEDDYKNSDKKQSAWWTGNYKKARLSLYGTKAVPPDFETAQILLQKEAGQGNGFAMYDLGSIALSGLGCDKDEVQAQEWFVKAYHALTAEEAKTEKKDYLQYRIGKLFSLGYGVEQDYKKAARWYEKAVEEKNSFAAYSLGRLYHKGQGVEQDDTKAFQLYKMAAEHTGKPNAYAAYELGRMYQNGVGTEVDLAASNNWYQRAYKGFLNIEKDMADDKLYYRLGQMNLTGTGTEMDMVQAKKYFEKAAELDNLGALYGLGKLYLKKDFADYSPQEAVDYLLEAAKNGNHFAEYQLGRLYLYGTEVERDYEKAIQYLESAAEHGNPYAMQLLHSLHSNQNSAAAMGMLRLLQHISHSIQNRLEDEQQGRGGSSDRKLWRKINEKKQAQGLHPAE